MELSRQEILKASGIACSILKPHIERFKPQDKPIIAHETGFIFTQVFLGCNESELMFSIGLQWNYMLAGSISRIFQPVHIKLACITRTDGRFLRFKEVHIPEWLQRDKKPFCKQCDGKFQQWVVIQQDTSLFEY